MLSQPEVVLEEEVQPDVPWGLPQAVGGMVLAFGIYLFGTGVFYSADTSLYNHHNLEFGVLAYQVLVAAVFLTVFLLVLSRYPNGAALLGFRFPGWRVMGMAALSVVAILIGTQIVAVIFDALFPGFHLQGNAKEVIPHGHLPFAEEVGIFVWAAIEAPLTEETLFRGLFFQGLRHSFAQRILYQWAVAAAAVLSGGVFGFAHGELHTLPILIFLGVCLAYVFQYARSVYASALVHGIINAISVLYVMNSS